MDRRIQPLIVVWACLMAPVETLAQEPDDPIAALATRGMELVTAERYDEAIRVYLEAYALEPLGALLYNIAFIYDKRLSAPKRAARYYQQYIDAPDADDEGKLRAYARLRTLEARIRLAAPKPIPPLPPPTPAREIGGWVSTVAGATMTLTGITFMSLAASTHSDFEATDDVLSRRTLRDRGELQGVVGDVTTSVGLVALAVGMTLLLWGDDDHDARAGPGLVFTGQGIGMEARF